MTVNTQELRDLVEKATPGPWHHIVEDNVIDAPAVPCLISVTPRSLCTSPGQRDLDAAYIAAANPATVSALLAENDALRAELQARQWISVEDRLPDSEEIVLVMAPGSQFQTVNFDCWRMQREAPVAWSTETIETGMAWDEHEFDEITHWMPLPPAPPQGETACASK